MVELFGQKLTKREVDVAQQRIVSLRATLQRIADARSMLDGLVPSAEPQ